MANRFWVGGTGTWDNAATTHWSTTTGGASGASAPSSSDVAIFDNASGGGVITISLVNTPLCDTLTTVGFTGDFAGTGVLTITRAASISSTMTTSWTGTMIFNGTSANLTGIAGNTYTFSVHMSLVNATDICIVTNFKTTSSFQLTKGVFTLASNLTCASLTTATGSAGTRSVVLSTFTLTVSGSGSPATIWDGTTGGLGTFSVDMTAGGSVAITLSTSVDTIFKGGSLTYTGNLSISLASGTRTLSMQGANTFNDLRITQSTGALLTVSWPIGTTNTIETYTPIVTGAERIKFRSAATPTQYTLGKSGGTMRLVSVDLKDCIGGGGATVHLIKTGFDSGNNTNWSFTGTGMLGLF